MLKTTRRALRNLGDAHRFFWMSMAFVVLATAAIQYEEVIAPSVSKISNGFAGVGAGLKRLTGA